MKILDIIIIILLLLWLAAAVIHMVRNRKNGGCSGCGGNCTACGERDCKNRK